MAIPLYMKAQAYLFAKIVFCPLYFYCFISPSADLKRSKSSPVLPYVFEARAGASSSASGSRTSAPTAGVSRRESGKYKSQKKQ